MPLTLQPPPLVATADKCRSRAGHLRKYCISSGHSITTAAAATTTTASLPLVELAWVDAWTLERAHSSIEWETRFNNNQMSCLEQSIKLTPPASERTFNGEQCRALDLRETIFSN